ncbi:hypothetical protein CKAN_00941500 [Cinnamomum micranthum f. kanehirae]|uniref:Lysophospholipid acyltransferase 1 n=1 Tax=Cinnamomum micranthum f. kanehirae TaxID=337451 RepID=A0A3S3MQY0_9MAGN|nr:hypothetical protein CKAN_00941500 [Cinnamomum micranthum f. kanehirae]
MEVEMDSMASAIGVSVPVLRFLLCYVATIPVSFLCRLVPGALPKHLYSALTGAILSYLSFGFSSNLHFLVPMTLGYGSMLLFRRRCGIFTFFTGFGHVYYMSGDAWKEGGIDATGALMVLTLKVISCSKKACVTRKRKNRLIRCPSFIEYVGYCLCCGSHFAGPVYEMKDYLEWMEKRGIWSVAEKQPSPSPYGATLRALVQAAICVGIYLYLVPIFSTRTIYKSRISRVGVLEAVGATSTCLVLQHAGSIILFGPSRRLPSSFLVWGLVVGLILLRLNPNGTVQRMLMFLVLSLQKVQWSCRSCGTYKSALGFVTMFMKGSFRRGRKLDFFSCWQHRLLVLFGIWQQAVPPKMDLFGKMLAFTNFLYTLLVLNYSCIGFMVLSMHETIASYGSVYYIGTIVPIIVILLGYVIKPAKPARSKARKEQ